MRILILEIANGVANQSQVHDQHKPAKRYNSIENTGMAASGCRPLCCQWEWSQKMLGLAAV